MAQRRSPKPLLVLLLIAFIAAAWGCPPRPSAPVPPVDAGAEDAGMPDDGGSRDGSVAPRQLDVLLIALDPDGGRVWPSIDGGVVELDPTRALELRFAPKLKDVRIRLFDWNELVVESDDVVLPADGDVFVYRLELLEPLEPGRSYLLLIDAELGQALVDGSGAPWDDVRLPLRITGERKPERSHHPTRRKSSRRR
jgi:hypothetical protein